MVDGERADGGSEVGSGSSRKRESKVAIMILSCSLANVFPRQMRGPPPKPTSFAGIAWFGRSGFQRSGSNALGASKEAGSRWLMYGE